MGDEARMAENFVRVCSCGRIADVEHRRMLVAAELAAIQVSADDVLCSRLAGGKKGVRTI
jgi:hypothetical protein